MAVDPILNRLAIANRYGRQQTGHHLIFGMT